ncbi:MAG: hypothetical protein JWO68_614 [Actinomycetia bacterium]|nr:hypothetical protein [Actinomycetes bacterium]
MTGDHLDDDALSASLDGEATPAESAHVESCAECRARADELRAAANAIGTPLPAVDGTARDEAIRAALLSLPTRLESRRARWQPPTWAWGAAAAVLVVAVLVPVLGRGGSDGSTNTAASGRQEKTQRSTADSSAGASTLSAPAGPVDAGDLGSVDDGQLRNEVTAALQVPAAATAGPNAYDQAAPTTVVPAGPPPPCVDQLRAAQPNLGALRLVARATLDGRRARVLVFDGPGEAPSLWLYAVADTGCAVFQQETL